MPPNPDTSGLPTVLPSAGVPDATQRIPVSPASFGAELGQGQQEAGGAMLRAGHVWGQIAADDVTNQFEEEANKILHGDPNKTVQNPDGSTSPDLGYLGLRGRAALDQRQAYEKRLDDLLKRSRGMLLSPNEQMQFDSNSRRYRAIIAGHMGEHADRQGNEYAAAVNQSTMRLKYQSIAANPDDEDGFKHNVADVVDAATKATQIKYGVSANDPIVLEAQQRALEGAYETRIHAVGVNDPQRAMQMIEQSKGILGTRYDEMVNRYKAKALVEQGRQIGQQVDSGGAVSGGPVGSDALSAIRQFEGFISAPKVDTDGKLRVGYGSDTITKEDGTVQRVTADVRVTREDAERDLRRRTAEFQSGIVGKIGQDAWSNLSDPAKASLTSIAYNYGSLPDRLVGAAKSGDPTQLANAVRGLSGDNNGINALRRRREAANIESGGGAQAAAGGGDIMSQMQEGQRAVPGAAPTPPSQRTMAEKIQSILDMHLAPEAEAAAIRTVSVNHQLRQDTLTRDRTAFKTRAADSAAEALNTGQTTNPVSREEFIRHFGPEQGATEYEKYSADVTFGSEYKALQAMPTAQMEQYINSRAEAIPAGAPGYARQLANADRLRKAGEALLKQRREDPAGVVSRNPVVADALKGYDPNQPETFRPVAAAREEAQAALGVEPEYRSPITKDEALQLTIPLRTMLPGNEKKVLTDIGKRFQGMFGDQADKAFAYALRAQHVDAKVAETASVVARKLGLGQDITRADGRAVDQAKDVSAADNAVNGTMSRPQRAAPRVIGNPEEAASVEPSMGPQLTPPSPKALADLFSGALTDKQFDTLYGTGRAKEIRKRYPLVQGGPGGGQ